MPRRREFVRRAQQQHAAGVAADFEVPGDDEAVAGVVAFAAEDDDRAVDAEPLQHIDAAAAGVLHQHQAGDAVLLDRAAIDFAALFAGEDCVDPWSIIVIEPKFRRAQLQRRSKTARKKYEVFLTFSLFWGVWPR